MQVILFIVEFKPIHDHRFNVILELAKIEFLTRHKTYRKAARYRLG